MNIYLVGIIPLERGVREKLETTKASEAYSFLMQMLKNLPFRTRTQCEKSSISIPLDGVRKQRTIGGVLSIYAENTIISHEKKCAIMVFSAHVRKTPILARYILSIH